MLVSKYIMKYKKVCKNWKARSTKKECKDRTGERREGMLSKGELDGGKLEGMRWKEGGGRLYRGE